jgi:putative copper export protein
MNYHHILLIFHLLAATVWIGGHLLLVTLYLPKAIKENDRFVILEFQGQYERLGMTSLLILVASGVAMVLDFGIYPNRWFHFSDSMETAVSLKLLLLAATFALAMSARFFVIPRLKSVPGMFGIAAHIVSVTVIGILMLIVGSAIRFGGL